MRDDDGRPGPTGGEVLKGPLSDVFVPSLLAGTLAALEKRLGDRARLCDPKLGTADGAEVMKRLGELRQAWAGAPAQKERIVAGVERDVWLGTLTKDGANIPLAVCVERRRMREIELRMYHTHETPYVFAHTKREPPTLPTAVEQTLSALASGNASELSAQLDAQATLVTARGESFARADAAGFLASLRGSDAFRVERHGAADDGRYSAVELTVERGGASSALVLVASRGESGLITSLRVIG